MKEVFEYLNYRIYLRDRLKPRGLRKRLAVHLGCQISFISQVVHERSDLSLEHALQINSFFSHTEEEGEFFLLLVQMARSGTSELRSHFEKKIQIEVQKRTEIKKRIKVTDSIRDDFLKIYCGSWEFPAVHILCSIRSVKNIEDIARRLDISNKRVAEIIAFLKKNRVVLEKDDGFALDKQRVHIPRSSPFLTQLHTTWRLKSMYEIPHTRENQLHFSSIYGLDRSAIKEIQGILLQSLERTEKVVKDSPETTAAVLTLDWYEL